MATVWGSGTLVKVNGSWVDANVSVKVNGVWTPVQNIYVKENGIWKPTR